MRRAAATGDNGSGSAGTLWAGMPRGTIKAADGGASDIWIGPSRERASLSKLHATNRLGPLNLADQILISDQRDGGCEDATPPSAAYGGAERNRSGLPSVFASVRLRLINLIKYNELEENLVRRCPVTFAINLALLLGQLLGQTRVLRSSVEHLIHGRQAHQGWH